MTSMVEVWTPAAVSSLQEAFRTVYPAMTDEEFAQEVLRIATRTLYNWRSRPETKLRRQMQRELTKVLAAAPSAVAERFRLLEPACAAATPVGTSFTDAGLILTSYPTGVNDAIATLDQLAASSTQSVSYSPDALALTLLDWLTSSIGEDRGDADCGRITTENVQQVRTMISAIDTIERRAGGAECRSTARRYLHGIALPMLQREVGSSSRSALFSAVAELCELVGWMYYDAGQHGTGQAYFTQALRLAREVGDDALSAYLMTSITHQALYVGQGAAALRVAKVARNVAESASSPRVLVEADLLVARSYAALGDVRDATAALQRAEQSYQRSDNSGSRDWDPQWDEIMFASHAGTCWNDLGNTEEARRLLTQVWDASIDRPRRRIYSATQLGVAAARDGELELACQYGLEVLTLRDSIDSSRAHEHIERLALKLRPFKTTRVVRDFFEQSRLNPEGANK